MNEKNLDAALEKYYTDNINRLISQQKETFVKSKKLAFKIWEKILEKHKSLAATTIIVTVNKIGFSQPSYSFDVICPDFDPKESSFFSSCDYDPNYSSKVYNILTIIAYNNNEFKCETKVIEYNHSDAIEFTFL